jgi:hypothetical protein
VGVVGSTCRTLNSVTAMFSLQLYFECAGDVQCEIRTTHDLESNELICHTFAMGVVCAVVRAWQPATHLAALKCTVSMERLNLVGHAGDSESSCRGAKCAM